VASKQIFESFALTGGCWFLFLIYCGRIYNFAKFHINMVQEAPFYTPFTQLLLWIHINSPVLSFFVSFVRYSRKSTHRQSTRATKVTGWPIILSKARDVLWRCLKGAAHQQRRTSLGALSHSEEQNVFFIPRRLSKALFFLFCMLFMPDDVGCVCVCTVTGGVLRNLSSNSHLLLKEEEDAVVLLIILYTFHLKNKLSTSVGISALNSDIVYFFTALRMGKTFLTSVISAYICDH
jgi:hypothetical protein